MTRHDTNILFAALLCAFSLQLLCACSDDDIPGGAVQKEILFGFGGEKTTWELTTGTRAGADEKAVLPKTVGVFGYISGATTSFESLFANEKFFNATDPQCPEEKKSWPNTHGGNLWPYANVTTWTSDKDYKFAAYAPFDASAAVSLSSPDLIPESLTLPAVPVFSGDDYLYSDIVSVSYPDHSSKLEGSAVPMAMHHLMSRVRFCFKIGPRYKELRKIKLTKLEVKDSAGKSAEVKISFGADGKASAAVTSVAEISGEYIELDSRDNETDGAEDFVLSSADAEGKYRHFASLYVLPSVETSLSSVDIRVNYEVYDLEDRLLRKDVVSNTISLISSPIYLGTGKFSNINISIEPKYLYVLSDNDQDFDGFMIIKS